MSRVTVVPGTWFLLLICLALYPKFFVFILACINRGTGVKGYTKQLRQ